jgi:hypothetical protein
MHFLGEQALQNYLHASILPCKALPFADGIGDQAYV